MPSTAAEKIKNLFRSAASFAITSHQSLDGDAVGSEAALLRYLKSIGKNALAVNAEPTPQRYLFLDPAGEIAPLREKRARDFALGADVVIIVDASSWDQLGEMRNIVRENQSKWICIDHHIPGDIAAGVALIEPAACSTGQIVYRLLIELGARIDAEMAEALFVAVAADTGWFRFSNADAAAYDLAAELIRLGVSPGRIYEEMYEKNSLARVRLLGAALAELQLDCGGRVTWFKLPYETFARLRVDESLTEGIIDFTKMVEGTDVSIGFKEIAPRLVRVSFRSKGRLDVRALASGFGGGGHQSASGAEMRGALDDVVSKVLGKVKAMLTLDRTAPGTP